MSEEKTDFQRYREIYQKRLQPMSETSRISAPTTLMANEASPARGIPAIGPSSVHAAHNYSNAPARTFEQAYKDDLDRHQRATKAGVAHASHHPIAIMESAPGVRANIQEEYVTTVYNIVPRDLAPPVQSVGPPSLVRLNPPGSSAQTEEISYQKSQSNAYAKQLLNITKHNMRNMELPLDSKARTHPSGLSQQELYRRLQERQARRQAPPPTIETFAQNGEQVVLSKHRSNVMLTIVQPKVASAATPRHVYGAPSVSVTHPIHQTEQYGARDNDRDEGRRVLNMLKSASGCLPDPPPAHGVTAQLGNTSLDAISAYAVPSVKHIDVQIPGKHHIQEEVLNLDTKHAGGSASTSGQHSKASNTNAVPAIVPSPNSVPVHSNSLITPTVQQKVDNPIWNNVQRYDLQQLLAQVQAAHLQMLEANQDSIQQIDHNVQKVRNVTTIENAHASPSTQTVHQVRLKSEPKTETVQFNPMIAYDSVFANTSEKLGDSALFSMHPSKRKSDAMESDASKKRKPRPTKKRPTEPYLQNGPCYQVASKLPRCRECGRSAAVRSRNASIIFCRFIAFRKLKYNEFGQLEVYGFADPYADPKEKDTSLWSSNLQKVPADLTIEKSKFLLGQVGYKFCELFHQEKEAYFEHMSEDKTIAWKQAVQGVREMCDVCQTTLFNHHWVCSTCGFVVCIDCYKYRKDGITALEPTTKDKDTHGWLLCSAAKEPHVQSRLMLTQIIPSNCLYKLVRQMHGICALLEIPLNCECPLSKEPLFRNMKDCLEFIYPITIENEQTSADPFGGYEINGSNRTQTQKMVSVTIKQIGQVSNLEFTTHPSNGDADPFKCRVEFTQQYHENQRLGRPDDETNSEKQTYSFEGFAREIHTDGDHFDESLYTIRTNSREATEKVGTNNELNETMKLLLDNEMKLLVAKPEEEAVEGARSTNGNNGHFINADSIVENIPIHVKTEHEKSETSVSNGTRNGQHFSGHELSSGPDASSSIAPNSTLMKYLLNEVPKQESIKQESASEDERLRKEPTSNAFKPSSGETKPTTVPVSYSEEDRLKASSEIDQKTFTMIMKQVVKFDKSIFGILQPHMAHNRVITGPLANFVECLTIQRVRVRQFVRDFLDEFVFLRGSNATDDLSNERLIVDYNQSMRNGHRLRNRGERRMNLTESEPLYPDVAHEWLCNGKLLRLLDPLSVRNYESFHDQWERGQPVMVSAVASKMNMDLWMPHSFGRDFGEQVNDLINCFNGKIVRGHAMRVFWEGFEEINARLADERDRPMMLKLKDWPPGDDFAEMMPSRFYDLMRSLPLAEYTRREGRLNLTSRLSSFFVRPDLGPKMYSAYGSALHPSKGTTNLHLDISDAVNVMVYVGVPKDVPRERYNEKIVELIDSEDCDYLTRQRVRERKELPGALWHIYHAHDADKIRSLLNKIELERGGAIKPNHDPIHDQKWYLDRNMRKRLQQEYQVEGYAIVQCAGDAIFIPAGAPHQVRNLHNCIKVAEDFVSPENIAHCLQLTNEFRHLSKTHSNHEDKLQIKNIIYHTVKDVVSCIANPLIMLTCDRTGDS